MRGSMPEGETIFRRFVAQVRAIFDDDWAAKAGAFFRTGISAISDVNEDYLHLEEKAVEAPDLAWRAVRGLAGEKHAKAVADYARAENERIDLALKQRVFDDKARQERATADKLEAEAALAKLNELKARAELARTLYEVGVTMTVNSNGVIDVRQGQPPEPEIESPGSLTSHDLMFLKTLRMGVEEDPTDDDPQTHSDLTKGLDTSLLYTIPEKRLLGIIVDVIAPNLGSEGTDQHLSVLKKWFCKIGQTVQLNSPLYEISTGLQDVKVPCPTDGIVLDIFADPGATISYGQTILCRIEKR